MITLYGVYRSRASRPLWLLTETETPFIHIPVIQAYRLSEAQRAGDLLHTASPSFLRVNPLGLIPVMQDDDLILTESLAITLHLARKYGGPLGPKDAAELSLMEQWALFAATAVEPAALEILMAIDSGAAQSREGQAGLAVSAERLRRPLKRLESHLGENGFLLGGRFTVADLNTAECLRYAQGHPSLLGEFPVTKAWLEVCQARPAFQKFWALREAEPA